MTTTTTIASRLGTGAVRQHLYAEATTTQEECGGFNAFCTFYVDCCQGLICQVTRCVFSPEGPPYS